MKIPITGKVEGKVELSAVCIVGNSFHVITYLSACCFGFFGGPRRTVEFRFPEHFRKYITFGEGMIYTEREVSCSCWKNEFSLRTAITVQAVFSLSDVEFYDGELRN